MGSSVSGSLDKFAKISPAAALGSGKVKLPGGPTGGILGMLQEDMIGRAEAKQTQNAANMQMMQQEQNQNNQYNMALQQMMMGQQQKPSPYSPAPYANGGNVTLRRKMFKLGGSASAHGTGLTSGLSFNQGGSVKPGPDGRDRVHASKAGFIADLLTGGATFVGKRGKKLYDDIIESIGPKTSRVTGKSGSTRELITDTGGLSGPFRQYLRALKSSPGTTLGATGVTGAALGLPLYSNLLQRGRDMNAPNETIGDTLGDFAVEVGRSPVTFTAGLPFYGKDILESKDFGEAFDALLGKGESYGDFYETLYGSRPPSGEEITESALSGGREIEDDISSSELAERIATQDAERMREAMEMYQELIRGEDNTNKLATLGDALIAGGSSLLEGEGYGAAASAFNQPLSQARVGQEAADAEASAAAAQLAIGEDMSRRQADQELSMNLLAAGDLNTEEEIQAVLTARSVGISQRLPEDDKGEVDEDALTNRGAGVYVDPKQRYNKLFVAINSQGINEPGGVIYTNDPEKAKQHAKS